MSRALEKLRRIFIRRGIALSGAAIGSVLGANAVQAAPAGLAPCAAAAAAAKGAFAGPSTLSLVKGGLKSWTWLKIKTASAIGIAVLLATTTGTVTGIELSESLTKPRVIWSIFPNVFDLQPPVVAIQKAYPDTGGTSFERSGKILAINKPVEVMFAWAYDVPVGRIIFPQNLLVGNTTFSSLCQKIRKRRYVMP